jgi:hypothetical protein
LKVSYLFFYVAASAAPAGPAAGMTRSRAPNTLRADVRRRATA